MVWVATQPIIEKKNLSPHNISQPAQKTGNSRHYRKTSERSYCNWTEKAKKGRASCGGFLTTREKVQIKVNPWTRTVDAVPSNLVPENLPRTSSGNPEKNRHTEL